MLSVMRLPHLHFCPLDRDCRTSGAPARLHISFGQSHIGIALTPAARFVGLGGNDLYWVTVSNRQNSLPPRYWRPFSGHR